MCVDWRGLEALAKRIHLPGFGDMARLMHETLKTKERYAALGIDETIFYETMGTFKENVDECILYDGEFLFYNESWIQRYVDCKIFKLGILEFEMTELDTRYPEMCGLRGGDPVLSVHIPLGTVMTREALDDSYARARAFFPQYFPDFQTDWFLCSSWLLSPALKELLPEGSRILGFAADYTVTHHLENDINYFPRVFHTRKAPNSISELPGDTTLRRNIKRYLMDGGKIGWTTGLMKF